MRPFSRSRPERDLGEPPRGAGREASAASAMSAEFAGRVFGAAVGYGPGSPVHRRLDASRALQQGCSHAD
jgi:hypothetical protein